MPIRARSWRQYRIDQSVERIVWPGVDRPAPRALRKLMAQSLHRELDICHPEQGIFFSRAQLDGVVLRGTFIAAERAHIVEVEFLCLPCQQPFLDLFRKPVRIGGRPKGLARNNPRRLMVSMPVPI